MPRPPITWITTDWHLFHDRMIETCGRTTQFTNEIIRLHKMLVAPQDTLVNLGDVIFYQLPRLKPLLATIPGTHVLVRGNHDRKSSNWYHCQGYAVVCDALVVEGVLLTHKPALPLPAGARLNVHGHFHNLGDRVSEFPGYDPTLQRCLALEHTGYAPVKLQQFARVLP